MPVLPDGITFYCLEHRLHLATEDLLKQAQRDSTTKVDLLSAHITCHKRQVGFDGDGITWWIYGEFGTHKTRFIRTFPHPIRLLDFDLGTRSIQDDIAKGGIDVIHFDSEDPSTYERGLEHIANFDFNKYATLAVDSAAELEKSCIAKAKDVSNHEFIELSDWNPAGERFGKAIRQLRWYAIAYGVQVIITSNEEIDKEYAKGGAYIKDGGKLVAQEPTSIKGLPDLAGKWSKKAARLVDLIGHSRVVNSEPFIVFRREAIGGGGAFWEVKDRTGKLEKFRGGLCPPDWATLWKEIKNGAVTPTISSRTP